MSYWRGDVRITQRMFLALVPDEPILAYLRSAKDQIEHLPGVQGLRWLDSSQWHLTLAFLGEVSLQQMPNLKDEVQSICDALPPFQTRLGEVEPIGGGSKKQPFRGIWIRCQFANSEAMAWVEGLKQRLIENALCPNIDKKPLKPHITLARTQQGATWPFDEPLTLETPSPIWTPNGLTLMQSQLTPNGAIYTTLATWPLTQD